jgi:hypothetical protein
LEGHSWCAFPDGGNVDLVVYTDGDAPKTDEEIGRYADRYRSTGERGPEVEEAGEGDPV